MPNQPASTFDKKWLLLLAAGVCVYLYFYGSQQIPYIQHLGTVVGGLHAANFLINIAK